ncbi:MAG TPA: hypothetical protein VKY73_20450 [Polyangiaceae bacterium]|nr:hypothetical protein [Polyangiaceae bacterium]
MSPRGDSPSRARPLWWILSGVLLAACANLIGLDKYEKVEDSSSSGGADAKTGERGGTTPGGRGGFSGGGALPMGGTAGSGMSGTAGEHGGTGGGDGTPNSCSLPTLSEGCNGCITGRCTNVCRECRGQVACDALVECWGACAAEDPTCFSACVTEHQVNAGKAGELLLECVRSVVEGTDGADPCSPCEGQSLSSPM